MSPEKQNAPSGNPGDGEKAVFVGEEDVGARSNPEKDILAAIVIGVFALAALYFALTLQVTENVMTTPGLLPVLTSLTLLAMAIGLGVKAVRAGASTANIAAFVGAARRDLSESEARRTLFLMATIFIYVLAVDFIDFEITFPTPFFVFAFSGYELISGITLTILLKLFWGAAIGRCLLVAFVWVIILASIFRDGFHILLPGLA